METLEQKRRRLFGNCNYMAKYLVELNKLLKKEVKKEDLLSIVDTDKFISQTSRAKGQVPDYKQVFKFCDKQTQKAILMEEISNWNAPYMMYLSYSLDCGLMKIPSLHCFNWDFSFYDEHAGIIIFTRVDGVEEIVLDYYEEDGENFIELEIYRAK